MLTVLVYLKLCRELLEQVLYYGRSEFCQPNILASVSVIEELKEMSAKHIVLLEAVFADGFPYTLLDVVNKRVEDREELCTPGLSAIEGADFGHRERFIVFKLSIDTIEGM